MAFTSHGHHIPKTTLDESQRPKSITRCGGPALCTKCNREVAAYQIAHYIIDKDSLTASFEYSTQSRADVLRMALEALSDKIDTMINAIEIRVDTRAADGSFLLTPVLCAKAQVLAAQVDLLKYE